MIRLDDNDLDVYVAGYVRGQVVIFAVLLN